MCDQNISIVKDLDVKIKFSFRESKKEQKKIKRSKLIDLLTCLY